MQIAMEANASHEYSTRLSRRISESRAKAAHEGKRSGGAAPYGMENDGEGGLKFGDAKKVKVVRDIFRWFAKDLDSTYGITNKLNELSIKSPRGGRWSVAAVGRILRKREYRGDFVYNAKKSGEFHIVNAKHQVVPVSRYSDEERQTWKETDEGLFLTKGVYKPMIEPKVWDAAQKRLAEFKMKGSRVPRADGYPLSNGILICGHCGQPMYGCTARDKRVYRCGTMAKYGKSRCPLNGTPDVPEDLLLPHVLRLMVEEIKDINLLLTNPPMELRERAVHRSEERAMLVEQRDKLEKDIERADQKILEIDDPRTFKSLVARVSTMRDDLQQIDARLSMETEVEAGYNRDELQRLRDWYAEFDKRVISVPVNGGLPVSAWFHQDPFAETVGDEETGLYFANEAAITVDARIVSQALNDLGTRVEVWFEKRKEGKRLFHFNRGVFKLGQTKGRISKDGRFRNAPRSVWCNGIRDDDRCDNRMGTD